MGPFLSARQQSLVFYLPDFFSMNVVFSIYNFASHILATKSFHQAFTSNSHERWWELSFWVLPESQQFKYIHLIRTSCSMDKSYTGGSRLMKISLVRISLPRFFKTFHKYLANVNFGLFISLVRIFGQNIQLMRIFGLFISLLRFALC